MSESQNQSLDPALSSWEKLVTSNCLPTTWEDTLMNEMREFFSSKNELSFIPYYMEEQCIRQQILVMGRFRWNSNGDITLTDQAGPAKKIRNFEPLPKDRDESTFFPVVVDGVLLYHWICKIENSDAGFFAWCIKQDEAALEKITDLLRRYWLPDSFKEDPRFIPYFSLLEKKIVDTWRSAIYKQEKICLGYFYFDSFYKYVDDETGYLMVEAIAGIEFEIQKKITERDQIFVLSPRRYLVIFYNQPEKSLQNKFYPPNFHIKSLILNYRVNFTTLPNSISDFARIWKVVTQQDRKFSET